MSVQLGVKGLGKRGNRKVLLHCHRNRKISCLLSLLKNGKEGGMYALSYQNIQDIRVGIPIFLRVNSFLRKDEKEQEHRLKRWGLCFSNFRNWRFEIFFGGF